MRRPTARTIGLLFFATSSVYSGPATAAAGGNPAAGTGAAGRSGGGVANAHAAAVDELSKPSTPSFYFSKAVNDAAAAEAQKLTANTPAVIDVPAVPGLTAPAAQEPSAPATPPADPFGQTTVVEQSEGAGGQSLTDTDVSFDTTVGTVEIHVNDANLVEVLRMLSLQSQKNIIASKDVKGTVTANLYGVTVREALDAILGANGYAYREEGNFIYVYTAQELKAQDQANRVRKTQVFRLYYTPVATAVNMIKPVLSKDGEVAFTDPSKTGLDSGVGDAGGNTHATEDVMVITDFTDRLDEVKRVLAEIDRRPQQILIEATILRATLNEDNAMGIDFQVLGGVDFGGLTSGGGSAGALVSSGTRFSGVSTGAAENGASYGGTAFTNNVPKGGLQLGLVQNNIAVFLEALETVTDTTVLANPKILALNKQKGEVIVGREDGYVTSTTTDTATVQTVEFLKTGTRLIFRPYIGDDGFIRMEIHPEDSSGGLTGANLPFKVTTEVTSNVLVRDGHTVVIGGLFREDSNSTRGQVPGLGNIPFAGALFRSQRDRTTREEIIILLTPHIVKDESVFSQMSADELHRMDQLRVGVRRGMMISGRERLAETFYDSAVAESGRANPDRNKILWDLNAAINLNPKFVEAVELKQQITGREITTVDNSIARDFLRKLAITDVAHTHSEGANTDPTTRPSSAAPAPAAPVAPAAVEPEAPAAVQQRAAAVEAPAEPATTQPAAVAAATVGYFDASFADFLVAFPRFVGQSFGIGQGGPLTPAALAARQAASERFDVLWGRATSETATIDADPR